MGCLCRNTNTDQLCVLLTTIKAMAPGKRTQHTPAINFALNSLCRFSLRSDKTLFTLGSSFMPSYQLPRLKLDRGALICLRSTGSSVTIMFGPTRAGEPE